MENDLIYRGDIFQRLCEYCSRMKYCDKKGCVDAEIINSIPAVDAVEVRHGRWVFDFALGGSNFYKCSECGRQECLLEKYNAKEYMPYCHCGAKMDGEEEHNAAD